MYTLSYPVRINDINYGGHMGHVALASIVHDARSRFLYEVTEYTETDIEGVGLIQLRDETDLIHEVFPYDTLTVNVLPALKGAKLEITTTLFVGDQPTSRSVSILAFFDYASRKMVKPPLRFRQRLENYHKMLYEYQGT